MLGLLTRTVSHKHLQTTKYFKKLVNWIFSTPISSFNSLEKLTFGKKSRCSKTSSAATSIPNTFSIVSSATQRSFCEMAKGVPLSKVVSKLKTYAPLSLAESWDNVGLLVEPCRQRNVKTILLTNDLTEDVMNEVLEVNADLIISYHPPIFSALKSVTTRTWKERLVAKCLQNGIAVYSPHTTFDALKGGVNDWLASAFDNEVVEPLSQISASKESSHFVQVFLPDTEEGDAIVKQFQELVKQGTGLNGNEAYIQEICKRDEDTRIDIACSKQSLLKIVEIFYDSPFADDSRRLRVSKNEECPVPGHGVGRLCKLKNPVQLKTAIENVKSLIKMPHVRVAVARGHTLESTISSVALCAGAGTSVLRGTRADLYLTGEMSHHDVLDAVHNGIHVILCEHSNSERGFLKVFAKTLARNLLDGEVQVIVSKQDRDPLETV